MSKKNRKGNGGFSVSIAAIHPMAEPLITGLEMVQKAIEMKPQKENTLFSCAVGEIMIGGELRQIQVVFAPKNAFIDNLYVCSMQVPIKLSYKTIDLHDEK